MHKTTNVAFILLINLLDCVDKDKDCVSDLVPKYGCNNTFIEFSCQNSCKLCKGKYTTYCVQF